jgi:hypothetical protein
LKRRNVLCHGQNLEGQDNSILLRGTKVLSFAFYAVVSLQFYPVLEMASEEKMCDD